MWLSSCGTTFNSWQQAYRENGKKWEGKGLYINCASTKELKYH
jgi:hypothetical protein